MTLLAVSIGVVFFVLSVTVIGRPPSVGFVFAVGMVVAFVPEGLLPTVTLALAMGVQRMARRKALIKKLSAVETLGACTVICTDKTGTLTQNEMTVREAFAGGARFSVSGVGYEPRGGFAPAGGAPGGRPPAGACASCSPARCCATTPGSCRRRGSAAGRSSATPRRPRCWSPRPRAAWTRRASRGSCPAGGRSPSTRGASA